jgi:hypothetical protein
MLLFSLVTILSAAPAGSARLPLKAMVLYENGLGYFERKGEVKAGSVAEIPLEPGQLDDALKSLVVVSDRGVASVEFAPPLAAEAARALAGMPAPEEQHSLAALLHGLQGVDVKVTPLAGAALRGRVIEVADEQNEVDREGHAVPTPTLMIFGESGLQRVSLKAIASVRPVDPSVQLAWDRASGSAAQQPDRQTLRVRAAAGAGNVTVGYTTEAPVWRTTYRMVLDKHGPRLQGYALVHNDSDEAWEGVKVTLASGRPTSFLFPLAGPRYGRRELVSPADGLDAVAQLSTPEAREHLRGSLGTVGLGMIGSGRGGGGAGYGVGAGSVHASGRGAGAVRVADSVIAPSDLLEDGPSPLAPAAVSEAGELFLYTVKEPVFLGARKSALLPIIDGRAGVEAVTVFDSAGAPTLAMRFSNDTGLTLEAGTVSIFTDGAYAGEAQLDRVKPGEVRIVKHGEDLDLEVVRSEGHEEGVVKKVRRVLINGSPTVELHRIDRQIHTLKLTSRSLKPRTLLVELPNEGYRVTAGAEEDVRSPGQPRFARVKLKPKEEKEAEVVEEGAVVERIRADALSTARLDRLLSTAVPADVKGQLVALRAEVSRVEESQKRQAVVEVRIREVEVDVARTRDNLAAAGKGNAQKTANELGERLLKLEDELGKLRYERDALGKNLESMKKALMAMR